VNVSQEKLRWQLPGRLEKIEARLGGKNAVIYSADASWIMKKQDGLRKHWRRAVKQTPDGKRKNEV
jgi:hypothetical protein